MNISTKGPQASAPPGVSIIIVTFDGERFLGPLLASLEAQSYPRHRMEIIVVDNASRDASCQVAAAAPGVRLIPLAANKGYAAANNIGLEAASHDLMVFLNQDTLCHRDWLVGLVHAFLARTGTGAVTSSMLLPAAPEFSAKDLCGPVPATLYFMDLSLFGFGAYRHERAAVVHPRIVSGCSFITSRSVIRDAGGLFDESLRMYVEDTDFSLRLINKGYSLAAVADSLVYHLHEDAVPLDAKRVRLAARAIRNRVVVFFKNMTLAEFLLFLPLLILGGPLKLREKPVSSAPKLLVVVGFGLFSLLVMLGGLLELPHYNSKRLATVRARSGGSLLVLKHMLARG